MRPTTPFLLALLPALLLGACSDSQLPQATARAAAEEEPPFAPTIEAIQDNVFTPACTDCHAGARPSGGLALDDAQTSYDSLVDVNARAESQFKLVAPGAAGDSYLIHKLEDRQTSGSRMPLGRPALSQAEIDVIREWIDGGALPPGSEPPPDDGVR